MTNNQHYRITKSKTSLENQNEPDKHILLPRSALLLVMDWPRQYDTKPRKSKSF